MLIITYFPKRPDPKWERHFSLPKTQFMEYLSYIAAIINPIQVNDAKQKIMLFKHNDEIEI